MKKNGPRTRLYFNGLHLAAHDYSFLKCISNQMGQMLSVTYFGRVQVMPTNLPESVCPPWQGWICINEFLEEA